VLPQRSPVVMTCVGPAGPMAGTAAPGCNRFHDQGPAPDFVGSASAAPPATRGEPARREYLLSRKPPHVEILKNRLRMPSGSVSSSKTGPNLVWPAEVRPGRSATAAANRRVQRGGSPQPRVAPLLMQAWENDTEDPRGRVGALRPVLGPRRRAPLDREGSPRGRARGERRSTVRDPDEKWQPRRRASLVRRARAPADALPSAWGRRRSALVAGHGGGAMGVLGVAAGPAAPGCSPALVRETAGDGRAVQGGRWLRRSRPYSTTRTPKPRGAT